MACFVIVLLIVGLLVGVAAIQIALENDKEANKNERKLQAERCAIDMEQKIEQQIKESLITQGFEATRLYTFCRDNGIAVDQKNKRVCIINGVQNYAIYSFEDILSFEVVVKEGETISKIDTTTTTSRGSQLGGAVVGGLIAGPAGVVVGGFSGKKKSTGIITTSEKHTSVVLNIIVRDSKNPIHRIVFIDSSRQTAFGAAHDWHAYLTVVMKEAEEEKTKNSIQKKDEQKYDSAIAIEICKNCDRKIGRLESAYVFNNQIVCHECHQKLVV